VDGYITASGGVGWGVHATVTFPIYPKFTKPKFTTGTAFGIVGLEVRAGAKGSLTAQASIEDTIDIFK
jgi:hypothetical protein